MRNCISLPHQAHPDHPWSSASSGSSTSPAPPSAHRTAGKSLPYSRNCKCSLSYSSLRRPLWHPADNKTTPAGRSLYPAADAPTPPSDRPYPLPWPADPHHQTHFRRSPAQYSTPYHCTSSLHPCSSHALQQNLRRKQLSWRSHHHTQTARPPQTHFRPSDWKSGRYSDLSCSSEYCQATPSHRLYSPFPLKTALPPSRLFLWSSPSEPHSRPSASAALPCMSSRIHHSRWSSYPWKKGHCSLYHRDNKRKRQARQLPVRQLRGS